MGDLQGLVPKRGVHIHNEFWIINHSIMELSHMMLFPNTNPYSGKMEKVKCLRNWMIDAATILFDDSKNDLRALPKTVRLQILLTLSFLWSTAFTIYFWGIRTDLWLSWFLGHLAVIFVAYYTFKQFNKKPYTMRTDKNEPPMYDDVWGA